MYKKGVLKFYDRQLRFDAEYAEKKTKLLSQDENMTFFKSYGDFCSHLGYHENIIFKNKSYKNLRKKWTDKGPDKLEGVYLYMKDLQNMHEICDWISYCNMRQELNFRRAIPELCMKEPDTGAPTSPRDYLRERHKVTVDDNITF